MAEPRHFCMRKVEEPASDFYSGSLDDLVSLGFVPREKFPGEPGQPVTKVAVRPKGVSSARTYWNREPGYAEIARSASGRYQMRVTISDEERAKRERARSQRRSSLDLQTLAQRGRALEADWGRELKRARADVDFQAWLARLAT